MLRQSIKANQLEHSYSAKVREQQLVPNPEQLSGFSLAL
jgi:hypothetical protein